MDEGYCIHCREKGIMEEVTEDKVFNPRIGDVIMKKGKCSKCKKGMSKIIKNNHIKVGKGEKRVPNRADLSHYPVKLKMEDVSYHGNKV